MDNNIKMDRDQFFQYIKESFSINADALMLVDNILKYAEIHNDTNMEVRWTIQELLDGFMDLHDEEIQMISFKETEE